MNENEIATMTCSSRDRFVIGKKREKKKYMYGGKMCGTVTPPSADCERRNLVII
jgi:hypothetical protein